MNEDETIPEVEQEEETTIVEETIETPEAEVDFKAEAAKWRAIAQRNRTKAKPLQAKQEPIDESIVEDVKTLKQAEKKRQFGYEHSLSPEETDKVFKLTGGNPTADTLKDPFILAGLEAHRSSKRIAANTPSSSTSSKVFGGKPFDELSKSEKQKAWEDRMKNAK